MFETILISRLVGKIPDECIATVRNELSIVMTEYDVVPKTTDLVPYENVIPDVAKYYIASKQVEGLSKNTLRNYTIILRTFFNAIRKPMEEITTNDVRAYLYQLQASGKQSNATLDRTRCHLNTFFNWCVDEGYLPKNPVRQIKTIKCEKKERRFLSDEELEIVRDACADITETAIIEFLYSTGCRVSELTSLKRSDVDFQTHEVKLFGKGSKYRTSYMNAKCELTLRKYLLTRSDASEYLFVGRRKPHSKYENRSIEKMLKMIGERANLPFRLIPHILRHTTATHALQHGMDVTEIQKLLGHSKIDTTMIYAKTSQDDVKANHRKYGI